MFRVFNCLATEHDWRLVLVAGLVCFLASVTAVSLFYRARATKGRVRVTWVLAAGFATGCGIWATHFIAMLSYDPGGVPVAYAVLPTILSLLIAAAVTGWGLAVALYPARWAAPAGGAVVGGGVACMHYLGMRAVEIPGHITWSLDLVIASIVAGMLLGAAALSVAARGDARRNLLLASILLTLAVVSHHFTAMGAVTIVPDPTRVATPSSLSEGYLASVSQASQERSLA